MKFSIFALTMLLAASAFASENCPNLSGTYEINHAGQKIVGQFIQNDCGSLTQVLEGQSETQLMDGVQRSEGQEALGHFHSAHWEGSKAVMTIISTNSDCFYMSSEGKEIYFHTSVTKMELVGQTLVMEEIGYDKDGKQVYNETLKGIRK